MYLKVRRLLTRDLLLGSWVDKVRAIDQSFYTALVVSILRWLADPSPKLLNLWHFYCCINIYSSLHYQCIKGHKTTCDLMWSSVFYIIGFNTNVYIIFTEHVSHAEKQVLQLATRPTTYNYLTWLHDSWYMMISSYWRYVHMPQKSHVEHVRNRPMFIDYYLTIVVNLKNQKANGRSVFLSMSSAWVCGSHALLLPPINVDT